MAYLVSQDMQLSKTAAMKTKEGKIVLRKYVLNFEIVFSMETNME